MSRHHTAALLVGAALLAVPLYAMPQAVQPATATSLPPTTKIRHGEVNISLALATASLAKHGIRNPTSDQIKAALEGGTVVSEAGKRVTFPGVLKLRATGMGWGEIAHKLGEVPRRLDGRYGSIGAPAWDASQSAASSTKPTAS